MSLIYWDGFETECTGAAEAAWVPAGADPTSISANGQTDVVRSGDVGGNMSHGLNLHVNPKWSDTTEDYWVVHIELRSMAVPVNTDAVWLCTTPNPYADGGTWFKIQFSFDQTANEIDNVKIFKGASDGVPTLAGGDLSFVPSAADHWLAFRFYKGDGGNAPSVEAFLDDVSKGTLEGTIGGETVNARVSMGLRPQLDAKDNPRVCSIDCDDLIILDEDSSGSFDERMVAATSSGVIIGFQGNADVTGYNDYVTTNPANGKKYRRVDDFNRVAGPPGDDWIIPASTWKQLFQMADISDGSPTVTAVRLDLRPRSVDTTGSQFLAGVSDEGTGPETITGWDDGVTGFVTHLMPTTPKDGNAWTKARFNDFYAGLTRTSALHIRTFGAQVIGIGLTTPTANPDSDNDDVADPWAVGPVTGRRRRGLVV